VVLSQQFFVICPKGFEEIIIDELSTFGISECKATVGGVSFNGSLEDAYRVCLWSRLANKVLTPLVSDVVRHIDDIYKLCKSVAWSDHLDCSATFAVDFNGQAPFVRNTHFGALKVKDAIVDYFRDIYGERPSIAKQRPDIQLNAHLNKGVFTLYLDLSGESLHRRGYRLDGGLAPLKENLAAAILQRAGWKNIAASGGALLDPMCGSGTLLIEGAMIAADIAPGLSRDYFGFMGWRGHVPELWQQLISEAVQRKSAGLAKGLPEIRGYDASVKALNAAEENIERAGLSQYVRVSRKELQHFAVPTHTQVQAGLVVTNPPYGERLGETEALVHLYQYLGERMRRGFEGWQLAMITGNPELGKRMGIRSYKQYQFRNGNIQAKLLLFKIESQYFVIDSANRPGANPVAEKTEVVELSEGATMFANRLRKNLRTVGKWAKQNDITCYRIYDADMPEYAVAVDLYNDNVHVSEYAPPKSIDPDAAERRIEEVLQAIPEVLGITNDKIFVKRRQRQKGTQQYTKFDSQKDFFEVQEGDARLVVNLSDYLDTGLFLDHRLVRLDIAKRAYCKRFLNLFCYTATASIHAAKGGAAFSVSVDMSNTYLNWAAKNIAINGLSESKHRLVRANVMEWLEDEQNNQLFDLILLDPPTFSNSKRMDAVFDVQRDHVALVDGCMARLEQNGLLIFSNNYRKFILDEGLINRYDIQDVSAQTIDMDFKRNQNIHKCWHIRHKAS
jgi:23S rRNA (guanine2445-N2)-methyltransferase / 23S rRNA (guanine2069-N7)-methyltransferase